jgi:DNA-binding transcriptional ArsR family regulator
MRILTTDGPHRWNLKAVKVLTDPETFELLADTTRRRMINLLKARELTVSQIAESLNKTPQNIYHHIRKLVDGGLVEVTREERTENFVERYYRATAEIFEVTHGSVKEDFDKIESKAFLKSMSSAGLVGPVDDRVLTKAVKILEETRSISFDPHLVKRLEEIDDTALAIRLHTMDYAQVLLMSEAQFDEYQRLQKELRDVLRVETSRR